jgi:hypothetical protein
VQPAAAETKSAEQAPAIDASLTSDAPYEDFESSARLIETPAPAAAARAPLRMPELVAVPPKAHVAEVAIPVEEQPRYTSRNWRAEAWERERERELRGTDRHAEMAARRRSN